MSGPSDSGAAPSEAQGHDGRPAAVLVGYMAAGKSAVGRLVAARLGLPFVDTDLVVEATHGPIPAIFARGGERLFRELEGGVVLEVLSAPRPGGRPLVALGGGAVTTEAVRTALAGAPLVLWLQAPADVLWERARRAPQGTRPLAEDEAAFRALLSLACDVFVCDSFSALSSGGPSATGVRPLALSGAPEQQPRRRCLLPL